MNNKTTLNFNIECSFNEEGKKLTEIIEELFLLNIKNLDLQNKLKSYEILAKEILKVYYNLYSTELS